MTGRLPWTAALTLGAAAAAAGQGDLVAGPDYFEVRGVEPGDTVRIGDAAGRLVALGPERYRLQTWGGAGWGPIVEGSRRLPAPTDLRRVALEARHAVRLGEGAVRVVAARRRDARRGLALSLEVEQAAPDVLVTGLDIELRLAWGLDDPGRDARSVAVEVEPLLAGETARVGVAVPADALDVRVGDLAPRVVPLAAPAARPALLALLADEPDPERLPRLYAAAGRNGDPALVRLLVGDALAAGPDRRRAARRGLAAAGAVAVEVVTDALTAPDDALARTALEDGALVRRPLPPDADPRAFREGLVGLLADLPTAWRPRQREALLALYRARPLLRPAVRRALARRPADAVARLLDSVLAVPAADDTGDALTLLASLPEAEVLPAALAELEARGHAPRLAEGEGLAELLQRAARAEEAAWRAWREAGVAARLAAVEDRLERLDPAGALRALRRLLAREPSQPEARALLPGLLVEVARLKLAAGRRAEGVALLEEALEVGPESDVAAEVRTRLAAACLAAAGEELDGVVVRAAPRDVAEARARLEPGAAFSGVVLEAPPDWVELRGPEEAAGGYVRLDRLRLTGVGRFEGAGEPPTAAVLGLVGRAESLDPAAETDPLRGRLHLEQALHAWAAGDADTAVARFAAAEERAPLGEHAATRRQAWLRAHALELTGLAALLLALAALARWARRELRDVREGPPRVPVAAPRG